MPRLKTILLALPFALVATGIHAQNTTRANFTAHGNAVVAENPRNKDIHIDCVPYGWGSECRFFSAKKKPLLDKTRLSGWVHMPFTTASLSRPAGGIFVPDTVTVSFKTPDLLGSRIDQIHVWSGNERFFTRTVPVRAQSTRSNYTSREAGQGTAPSVVASRPNEGGINLLHYGDGKYELIVALPEPPTSARSFNVSLQMSSKYEHRNDPVTITEVSLMGAYQ